MSTIDSLLPAQLDALSADESNPITILANASAVINAAMSDLNWAGFYLYNRKTDSLDLGPFQGLVACTHIRPGSGVVGTSFADKRAFVVANVHEFAGHIACDAASNSEVVVPLTVDGETVGVLDIDSPLLARFDEDDLAILQEAATVLSAHLDAALLAAVY